MAKYKRFTPEQVEILVELEKTKGRSPETVKEAKKTKKFMRISEHTIDQKLYKIWRDRIGYSAPLKIKTHLPTIDNTVVNNNNGWIITSQIDGDEVVISYTIRVKLPK